MHGHCIVHGGMMKKRKEGSSVSAGSQPPTGALCMKSVGFRTLSSHTSKGDSINYISQRALRHRTRQQTHRDREWEREREREADDKEGEGTGNVTAIWGWARRKERVAQNKRQRLWREGHQVKERRGWLESETYNNADTMFRWAETDEACHLKVTTAILELASCTVLFLWVTCGTMADIQIRWYS